MRLSTFSDTESLSREKQESHGRASRRLYNAEEFEYLPLKERYELIRGELYRMPNNSAEHGYRTSKLNARVDTFVEDRGLGFCFTAETRFTIESDPDTVLAPDFAFVSIDRISELPESGYLRLTPDLIMETKSPSETRRGYADKISHWLASGAKVVWALEPKAKTLTIHRKGMRPIVLTELDTLTCEELLPGFSYELAILFSFTHIKSSRPK